ncbi:MAG: sugar ABC transporter ATP-binding protein [Bacilli bacterium]
MENVLEVKGVTKRFGGIVALNELNLNIKNNRIHFIVGENGAGKSTILKSITGVYNHKSYDGEIYYKGKLCEYNEIRDSEDDKIAIIHQELALNPFLSVYENIFLGHEIKKNKMQIDWDTTRLYATQILESIGVEVEIDKPVGKLSIAKQQMIEIAKALSKEVDVLILDEPTSSLNEEDSEKLLNLLVKLKSRGMTIIMISHKLNEIFKIADDITIIRDGQDIKEYDLTTYELEESELIANMVGREITNVFPPKNHDIHDDNILELNNVNVYGQNDKSIHILKDINMHVKRGEVVALAGLVGAGRTEVALTVFGKSLSKNVSGEIKFNGEVLKVNSAKDAIAKKIMYVSEDRKALGTVLMQSIYNNISYSSLEKLSKYQVIDKNTEIEQVNKFKEKLNVKTDNVYNPVSSLSGGNQQKVVLARCLLADPDLLIIDEPTRGIDVGSKSEIYHIMDDFIKQGKSVLMISSELPEVLGIADRIYVMNEGQIKGEIDAEVATQEKIMEIAIGGKE